MIENQETWQAILNELSENKIRFTPIRGTQDAIDNISYKDGNIYFATDTKMIWLDTLITNKTTQQKELTRILMGNGTGGGSSNTGFLYADADFSKGSLEQPDLEQPIYYIYKQAFEEDAMPLIDTLIINSNGWFFRVIELGVGEHSNRITAELISSGSGGGGGGSESLAEDINITIVSNSYPKQIINGHDAYVSFIPTAAKDRKGNNIDDTVNVAWKLEYTENGTTYIQYAMGTLPPIDTGVETSFNFGAKAKHSASSRLTLTVSEDNSTKTYSKFITFESSDLILALPSSVSNIPTYNINNVSFSCNQEGNMSKLLEFYWDDELIDARELDANSDRTQNISINDHVSQISHGVHTFKVILSQYINQKKGFSVDPIEFEVATLDANKTEPIIWLGKYQNNYYNYDNIQIPFRVWVAEGTPEVHLYKDNKELEGSPRTITETNAFSIFEIVDFDLNMQNHYAISCEEIQNNQPTGNVISRDIFFTVQQDPKRADFGIQKSAYLTLAFDASGRSNSESELKRSNWTYQIGENNIIKGKFENFNWYNNGWITENGKTCLRISNGAKFSIPIGDMVFAGSNTQEQSHSFEFQFKIRNVQDYSNLIRNVTRYKNDDALFAMFYDDTTSSYLTSFTNYDAFLADFFKNGGTSGDYQEYDDLIFDHVEKQINLNAVACGFFSGNNKSAVGVCLGPQDAFFSNGTDTVNVNYVEDTIINLSAVYSDVSKLIYIYINGVLTGVIKNSVNGPFSVTSSDSSVKALEFNSSFCDIDLYKIRIYRTDLNVNDIVTNFAVDLKDVLIYDQNKLAVENTAVQEYQFNYNNMINYNTNHIDSPIMPYIIFDTSKSNNDDKLSYAKSVKVKIGVEFVNTPLELAYQTGELEALSGPSGDKLWDNTSTTEEKAAAVKYYYQHHCPSWKGEDIQMAVQGTSSEFYPRRNYKLKTKGDNGVNIYLNRGPFESEYQLDPESTRQSYWYMDNYTAGTTKFTMKIDYMESSGSYNMGFANMVKNAYSKHPFNDLNNNGAFEVEDYENSQFAVAETFDPNAKYYYINHKGNLKVAADELGEITALNFAGGPDGLITDESKKLEGNPKATYGNHFITIVELAYKNVTIPLSNNSKLAAAGLVEYRTSVQGFRTLTFHKKSDGSYTYIGMYNMLLDKGSDEMYGFKPDKTDGRNILQRYLKHKKISKIAECWEFENNSRTFCSFRDPMNRKDLSFDVYTMNGDVKVPTYNSVGSAPAVADSFEYRYHTDGDILDYIMDPDKNGDKLEAEDTIAYMTKNNVRFDFNKENRNENYEVRANFIFDRYKNWEKAVAWVWSTNTDSVGAGGDYTEVDDLGNQWYANTFYIQDENLDYILDTGLEYNPELTYYIKDGDTYTAAYLSSHVYETNRYYIKVNGDYVLSGDPFDKSLTYYQLTNYTDLQLEAGITKDGVLITYDRLVEPAGDTYDAEATYYSYDGTKTAGKAVTKLTNVTAEAFAADPSSYYVGKTVTYGTRSYNFDTKEYRADKFVNELEKHFDMEYLATYFVMTEVFECYDSRGKNAMFASWGPQEAGGEYIWYPIFYDIDTQLGINNTGIPSFEYNVDATENGNYSTSDSVLWNNFYKYFKSSRILMKYKHLKGVNAGVSWTPLDKPPLRSVANIEGQYRTDPDVVGSIAMRGKRPLIAINLDEYYKYITITNSKGYQDGTTGHISSDTYGTWTYDANGTYFYALQGDRSLSRQQFLANRLEYIDSWLNQGNYARGGSNRMWGRVAANNAEKTSDIWIEDPNDANTSYYKEENGVQVKRHPLDAEYWLNLTPTHSTYVTLGDDNEAYPSQKYDGINPVRFEISSIENGVRKSADYPEQLLYVYGMNQMSDVGDMSNLYWQEFKIEGEAKHLTRLLLGSDVVVTDYDANSNLDTEMTWKNNRVNPPSIPSSKESSGMPLLKEVNMCNIQINAQSPILDLTSCEKLQNFRATGSNFTNIKFADGVALDTLYLPRSITILELVEARLLTKLLTTYTPPTKQNNKLVAQKGLWIDGLFNDNSTQLTKVNLVGGGLGYDSYKLLKKIYDVRGGDNPSSILELAMTNVNWSPYRLVEEGETYSGTPTDYRVDNYHYGLGAFTYNEGDWETQVANHEIYVIRDGIINDDINQITDISMLNTFITNANYRSIGGGNSSIPEISGIIYVNNSTEVDEAVIRNEIQPKFPKLTFLFNSVTQRPTARFIYFDEDGVTYHYVNNNPPSIQTLSAANKQDEWFSNPITTYGALDKTLPNYDFFGWAKRTTNDATGDNIYTIGNYKYEVLVSGNPSSIQGSWIRPAGILDLDYTFYAIFKLHAYERKFYNADNTLLITNYQTYSSGYGVNLPVDNNGKEIIPILEIEDLPENLYYVNKFLGWKRENKNSDTPDDLTSLPVGSDYNFIALYERVSVYDNILDNKYLTFRLNNTRTGYSVSLNTSYYLSGKITLPTQYEGLPIVELSNFRGSNHNLTHIFWDLENRGLQTISGRCFSESANLIFYEQPDTCVTINNNAFEYCYIMGRNNAEVIYNIFKPVKTLGDNILDNLGYGLMSNKPILYLPGHAYTSLSSYAFSGLDYITDVQIGNENDPCRWFDMIGNGINSYSNLFGGIGTSVSNGIERIKIYIRPEDNTSEKKEALLECLGISSLTLVENDNAAAKSWIICQGGGTTG